jgi:Winged helix DNA-binding domain
VKTPPAPLLRPCELNRATLARQMLLKRKTLPVPAAIERLVGLQAQLALPPYLGLWTRLRDFRRDNLAQLIEGRKVVKAPLMRATLHICTAEDYLRFRAALQPMLTQAWSGIAKQRGADFDLDRLLEAARRFIGEKPRTLAEISDMVADIMPGHDVGVMRYAVRTHLPLVQVPISGGWSYSNNPQFVLAESWIGRPVPSEDNLPELVFRYLAAFGPASVTDMQAWSGVSKLKDTFEKLKSDLQRYRDEQRRELFDLPNLLLPAGDAPVPVRFLPEFDNLLLSHSNRTRVIADEHRSKVFLPGLRVRATLLVGGFVRGTWKIEKTKDAATLVVEPFDTMSRRDRAALIEEAERLIRFVEAKAKSFEVRFAE